MNGRRCNLFALSLVRCSLARETSAFTLVLSHVWSFDLGIQVH